MSPRACAGARITTWTDRRSTVRDDLLAVEEPLEIRLAGCSVAVTMRTPGDDLDLAAGFLFTEGILRQAGDIASIAHCPTDDARSEGNIVNVNPTDYSLVDPSRWQRNFFATSSCGICGKTSIDSVCQQAVPLTRSTAVPIATVYRLARELRGAQPLYQQTGGLHAAALFTHEGDLVLAREDVGRHNAVDKVIGAMVRQDAPPLGDYLLAVSSRASFEIVQKALMAGIPLVATVSAASTLAVDLARETRMTLIGFLRTTTEGGRFNIYAGEEWIAVV